MVLTCVVAIVDPSSDFLEEEMYQQSTGEKLNHRSAAMRGDSFRCLPDAKLPSRKISSSSHRMALFSLPVFMALAFLLSPLQVSARNYTVNFPANSTLHWTNTNSSSTPAYNFERNRLVRLILFRKANSESYGESFAFAFGFYCNRDKNGCLLAIMILGRRNSTIRVDQQPQVVWMANRDQLVKDNATLRASPNGGLTLTDSDGVHVWSSNVSHNSVSAMTLESNGNLMLFNSSKSKIWTSFRHPTNTLLMGQEFHPKMRLKSSRAHTDFRTGKFYMIITNSSLTAFARYAKPVAYTRLPLEPGPYGMLRYVRFNSSSISFFYKKGENSVPVDEPLSTSSSIQLLRLDPDGGPRVYIWQPSDGWGGLIYPLNQYDRCQQPLLCGKYGVCADGECSCPIASDGRTYFTPIYPQSLSRGCRFSDESTSNLTRYEYPLVHFGNLSYFSYFDPTAAIAGLTELEQCKQACEGDSSCKAAFFKYGSNGSESLCYLPTEILTIRAEPIVDQVYGSTAFLKVPVPAPVRDHSLRRWSASVIRKVWIAVVSAGTCAMTLGLILWRVKRSKYQVSDCFDHVIGAPTRFTYKELCSATGRFSTKLGRGGFGTVYRGELKDGTVIAVKRLDSVEPHMKEFVAEMKTMGNIHHIHLVKLIGFCAEEANRLLVYEYMSNGSLDKWIFDDERKEALGWATRRRIIHDIAKGLAYLHEDCSERIAHLDVKPHNILLDENFYAKISDFGLARFIDRSQSHVFTGMKGTFGYLAPEWEHSKITVKADIYSFGVVVLEIVSGRMVLDYTLPRSDLHLLAVLERLARDDRIIDIVDKTIPDCESSQDDVLKMINIAVCCLNDDPCRRPLMSTVVKILEETMEIEHPIEFRFDNALVLCGASAEMSCSG